VEQGTGLSASRPLPRWLQESERLIREIGAGRLPDGTRLPPERELAASLGIAVGTLRKSLADLESKGLLERRQGSGNYVRHRPGVTSVYSLFRLERPAGGGLPTAELLSVDRRRKPEGAPDFGPASDAWRIRRLRRLDGLAAAVEEIWLDGHAAPALRAEDLSESLYLSYRTALGLEIGQVEDRVGVAAVPGWAPSGFQRSPGTQVGHVERIGRRPDGVAVEYSCTWFDPDRARYVSRLGKGQG
jgi:GntR family transcriptional regulator